MSTATNMEAEAARFGFAAGVVGTSLVGFLYVLIGAPSWTFLLVAAWGAWRLGCVIARVSRS